MKTKNKKNKNKKKKKKKSTGSFRFLFQFLTLPFFLSDTFFLLLIVCMINYSALKLHVYRLMLCVYEI